MKLLRGRLTDGEGIRAPSIPDVAAFPEIHAAEAKAAEIRRLILDAVEQREHLERAASPRGQDSALESDVDRIIAGTTPATRKEAEGVIEALYLREHALERAAKIQQERVREAYEAAATEVARSAAPYDDYLQRRMEAAIRDLGRLADEEHAFTSGLRNSPFRHALMVLKVNVLPQMGIGFADSDLPERREPGPAGQRAGHRAKRAVGAPTLPPDRIGGTAGAYLDPNQALSRLIQRAG
jgi:hypothetical protein